MRVVCIEWGGRQSFEMRDGNVERVYWVFYSKLESIAIRNIRT